ncbi:AraC family transcriptional regulator [Achromobacter marplatensis]|jgi:AraC-like DNA-binding protein|uniref:AraC family transcriptional regulator n=1 Tax=Achromobacter marplatensis TaxID=470868 RepID=A0AA42WFY4_9BURK|nr:helix-turn-helix domain-containing protein [Achromobacter marplatensis]MDH2053708.1 helix-turn-helix domain-containing protein [Achromobacter marplatensis]OWT58500.1 AraC family transcriptional regulator [Achromobacter marplatensis]RBP15663.1 AraC family transcriptional regulator [Achromobacter marplatensis]CAB3697724.1 Transcriptional activator NphR [Achromobacter marplatensis]
MSSSLLHSAPRHFLDCASWQESISSTFVPLEVSAVFPTRFRNSVAVGCLGWMQVSELHSSAQRVRRSKLLAARAEEAGYKVTLQLAGRSEIRQSNRTALLMPGEWSIYDTTRPYEVDVDDGAHFLVMQVPGKQTEAWQPYMQNAVARNFSGQHGCGRMAMDLLRVALGEHAHLSESAARDAANAVLQMMGLDISERAGGQAEQDQAGLKQAQLRRVQQHILENLHDPALSPASAAAAFRMSRRYLYNLFALAATTPADFILSARLERSREALCDATQSVRQIGDIAYRFGFSDAARFSHAFRKRYGASPSEYRRQAR